MGAMPKMGHTLPLLGFKMGALPACDRSPMIFPGFGKSWATNGSPKWRHFRHLIAAEGCPDLG